MEFEIRIRTGQRKKPILGLLLLLIMGVSFSCKEENETGSTTPAPQNNNVNWHVWAADISYLPAVEAANIVFYDRNGTPGDPLVILKNEGVNAIRLRLWKAPGNPNSSFPVVKQLSERIKSHGLQVWLTVHYSATWADPGSQLPPQQWQGISFSDLKDSVYTYTAKIVTDIQPDFIQIGNEINDGFLWPQGRLSTNESQFIELLETGIQAVRDHSDSAKTMVHYAGLSGAIEFFSKLTSVQYDVMGISYYPWWHGKDLAEVETGLQSLSNKFNRGLVVAETAYPFTLGWNDWTNNIVGLEEHLILPEYPASQQGQKNYLLKLNDIIKNVEGNGFCYWGATWVAFDGPQSETGSAWENCALFDFENKAVKALDVFSE